MSNTSFNGAGETTRSSRVEAAMAVRVKKGLPNGDLFVEGTKVLMVNEEELHIYVSGVIRPEEGWTFHSRRGREASDSGVGGRRLRLPARCAR